MRRACCRPCSWHPVHVAASSREKTLGYRVSFVANGASIMKGLTCEVLLLLEERCVDFRSRYRIIFMSRVKFN